MFSSPFSVIKLSAQTLAEINRHFPSCSPTSTNCSTCFAQIGECWWQFPFQNQPARQFKILPGLPATNQENAKQYNLMCLWCTVGIFLCCTGLVDDCGGLVVAVHHPSPITYHYRDYHPSSRIVTKTTVHNHDAITYHDHDHDHEHNQDHHPRHDDDNQTSRKTTPKAANTTCKTRKYSTTTIRIDG